MVAGRGRRCHPLQVASPELEDILVWGYGVVLGMPRLQYILLDLIPTDHYGVQTKHRIHNCILPFISRLGQLKRQ